MIQDLRVNVELSNSQLDKLKSAAKNMDKSPSEIAKNVNLEISRKYD